MQVETIHLAGLLAECHLLVFRLLHHQDVRLLLLLPLFVVLDVPDLLVQVLDELLDVVQFVMEFGVTLLFQLFHVGRHLKTILQLAQLETQLVNVPDGLLSILICGPLHHE